MLYGQPDSKAIRALENNKQTPNSPWRNPSSLPGCQQKPPRYKIQLPASALLQVQVQNPLAVVAKRAMPKTSPFCERCFKLIICGGQKEPCLKSTCPEIVNSRLTKSPHNPVVFSGSTNNKGPSSWPLPHGPATLPDSDSSHDSDSISITAGWPSRSSCRAQWSRTPTPCQRRAS